MNTETLKNWAAAICIVVLYGIAGSMDYHDAVKAEAARTASAQHTNDELRLAMKGPNK